MCGSSIGQSTTRRHQGVAASSRLPLNSSTSPIPKSNSRARHLLARSKSPTHCSCDSPGASRLTSASQKHRWSHATISPTLLSPTFTSLAKAGTSMTRGSSSLSTRSKAPRQEQRVTTGRTAASCPATSAQTWSSRLKIKSAALQSQRVLPRKVLCLAARREKRTTTPCRATSIEFTPAKRKPPMRGSSMSSKAEMLASRPRGRRSS
mmetsp:Transcript_26805/g.45840  ORF Transcript_26805/g.45840 Transcript_26805/m.45840 type:complete len:207 (-) Transcript_26805:6414-7034(-)